MSTFRDLNQLALIGMVILIGALQARAEEPTHNDDKKNPSEVLRLEAGFDYSTGKYGTRARVSDLEWSTTATYSHGPYTLEVTLPYLWQKAPPGIIVIRGRPVFRQVQAANTRSNTVHGEGDIVTSLTRMLFDQDDEHPAFDMGVEEKFGTASAGKGLGTGKNDYSLKADMWKDWDKFSLSITTGYTYIGKPASVQHINNVFFGTFDGAYKLTANNALGMMLDGSQVVIPGSAPAADVQVYLDTHVTRRSKLHFYGLKGLKDGSPAWGGGASIALEF